MVHRLHLLPSQVHLSTMAKSFLLLLLTLFAHIFTITAESSNNIIGLPYQEKYTFLRFYWHNRLQEPNATAVKIIEGPINSPTRFGREIVFDNLITFGPSESSRLLGRSQGTFQSADLNTVAVIMSMTFLFEVEEYNGSTFSVLGRNELEKEVRELPIVGGTGFFRLARGYCRLSTVSINTTNFNAIVDYGCSIFHNPDVVNAI